MSKIAVVYWSGTGNTEAMANFVAEGATGAGAEAEVISCADFSADKAANYDAIAFGCPAMGSEELEYDEFQPMWDEVKETLGDKKVVLFGRVDGQLEGRCRRGGRQCRRFRHLLRCARR